MIEFLNKRRRQVESRRAGLEDQERQRAARIVQIKHSIGLMKSLLRDERYPAYSAMLREAKRSCELEREGLLSAEDDRDRRDHQVTLLTGRIMQLEFILNTPDQFLALADEDDQRDGHGQPVLNDSADRSPSRETVVAAKET